MSIKEMKKLFVMWLVGILSMSAACAAETAPAIIELPQPSADGMSLMQALKQRQSVREYADREIAPQDLSNLLWAAFGVNRPEEGKRTAPSGSNRQEIEVYAVFKTGIYHSDAAKHRLELTAEGDHRALTGRGFAATAPLNLLFMADTDKTGPGAKAGEANTVSYVDVGYISQNVYLYCASAGMGTVARGGWNQDALIEVMKIKPAYICVLGQSVGYLK